MEIKDIWGNTLFSLETIKTIAELVSAAISAGADLSNSKANLSKANLSKANLTGANLSKANLYGANLSKANLTGANLSKADLTGADLTGADLTGANLYGANLTGADLYGANLSKANLTGANLTGAKNIPLIVIAQLQFIPETGAFIGWKKCANNTVVKLGISASAQRSHSTGRKCRCSKAKTLAIYAHDGAELQETTSLYNSSFVYRKGKIVIPANGFDTNRWNECGAGIHFFITRVEAESFNF